MKNILLGAIGALVIAAAGIAFVFLGGWLSFAADDPHSPAVTSLIELARKGAIRRAAADIQAPADLASPERIRRGAGNYAAMCASCHLSPGTGDTELRMGLYPQPPDLKAPPDSGQHTPAERFWIIKHGIKGSGMPAWGKGGMDDVATWDLVAFLQVLPDMSAEAYRQQVERSDGHRHGGIEAPQPGESAAHSHGSHLHAPGARPHKH